VPNRITTETAASPTDFRGVFRRADRAFLTLLYLSQTSHRSTIIISATPGEGDVLVKLDGEVLACWYRNLNPMPCRVVLVDAKHTDEAAMQTATKRPLADLGVQFIPHDYKKSIKRFEALCAPCGTFAWHHLPHKSCTVVLGVLRRFPDDPA
jgi:hypothetical protein